VAESQLPISGDEASRSESAREQACNGAYALKSELRRQPASRRGVGCEVIGVYLATHAVPPEKDRPHDTRSWAGGEEAHRPQRAFRVVQDTQWMPSVNAPCSRRRKRQP
jgi:hypothetical protein